MLSTKPELGKCAMLLDYMSVSEAQGAELSRKIVIVKELLPDKDAGQNVWMVSERNGGAGYWGW